nr:winged helix-turn-helix domain-containing protein [Acidisoma sp. S159]
MKALVIAGPDPERDKVVRWRCVDLREEVARRFSVEVHESTIGKWLRHLDLTRLQPRPVHPKKNAAVQEEYKKIRHFAEESAARLHACDADRDLGSRRSSGRAEGNARLHLGASRFTSSHGTRQSP